MDSNESVGKSRCCLRKEERGQNLVYYFLKETTIQSKCDQLILTSFSWHLLRKRPCLNEQTDIEHIIRNKTWTRQAQVMHVWDAPNNTILLISYNWGGYKTISVKSPVKNWKWGTFSIKFNQFCHTLLVVIKLSVYIYIYMYYISWQNTLKCSIISRGMDVQKKTKQGVLRAMFFNVHLKGIIEVERTFKGLSRKNTVTYACRLCDVYNIEVVNRHWTGTKLLEIRTL